MDLEQELNVAADAAAQRLLGSLLVREYQGQQLIGQIVETESYDQTDLASHSYRGQSPKNQVMFGPAGRLYVYFTYGLHYCCNVVVGPDGHGAACLIRALEPLKGINIMSRLRGSPDDLNLTNGPAKVCQALAINKTLNDHDLTKPPLKLELKAPPVSDAIVTSTRIGISRAQDVPWRFYLKGNRFVSKM